MSVDVKVLLGNLCSIIYHTFEPTDVRVLPVCIFLSPRPLLCPTLSFSYVSPSDVLSDSINSYTFNILFFEMSPSRERLYLLPSASSNSIFIFFFPKLKLGYLCQIPNAHIDT